MNTLLYSLGRDSGYTNVDAVVDVNVNDYDYVDDGTDDDDDYDEDDDEFCSDCSIYLF